MSDLRWQIFRIGCYSKDHWQNIAETPWPEFCFNRIVQSISKTRNQRNPEKWKDKRAHWELFWQFILVSIGDYWLRKINKRVLQSFQHFEKTTLKKECQKMWSLGNTYCRICRETLFLLYHFWLKISENFNMFLPDQSLEMVWCQCVQIYLLRMSWLIFNWLLLMEKGESFYCDVNL